MADLPVELWHTIFHRLELTDLSSCALVSRALYWVVKSYQVREIAFTGRVYEWFHQDHSIYQYRVDYSMASLLSRSSFSLEHLKRLKIDRCSVIYDLNQINKLVHLEELDIDLMNYENERSKILSLANLKVLYLCMSEDLPYLELDTPKLAEVCTFTLKKLDFLHPDSIRCIRTFFHSGRLFMFRNLEYLTFTDRYNELDFFDKYNSKSFTEFSLLPLKKLKEIEFYYYSTDFERNNWSKIQKIIRNILALERPDLKVFWYGVQVTDTYLLTEHKEMMENINIGSLVSFQLQHFEKLKEKVDYFWCYNFNRSMEIMRKAGYDLKSEEFTSKFFAGCSFKRIDVAGKVKEEELLIELIARSPHLFRLEFSSSGLDQSFFDRMANTIQLNGIPLQELRLEKYSSLNLDFVLRLCHLELFETDQQLPNELISKMLIRCRPTDIQYGLGRQITRLSTNKFLRNEEVVSLQELLSEFDGESDSASDSASNSEPDSEPDSGSDSKFDSGSYSRAKCVLM